MKCGPGMEYNVCGPACPATCLEPNGPDKCTQPCVEGCYCQEGLLLSPDGCVIQEQCGCKLNGLYYAVNKTESFMR